MIPYQAQPSVNGKPAIRVNAKELTKNEKAFYFDLDGDKRWVPKSLCSFNKEAGTVDIQEWFYKMLFPNG
ncbi:MAG: hypothetical protein CVU09_00370 [Bacteroidetes bacterium HGW-Bacteroidetes-4]|jgi:hypothetical protein|nr:MAG: hypothetical protein CVU09_00370 [Bacteroidetes bacterium HGW-Bacteroidetes-4]